MSVMTGCSAATISLLKALGAPDNCTSLQINISANDPVEVICEYYPDEDKFDESGELITALKLYRLVEKEDDGT